MELKWDQIGERYYETGVDRGVLYPMSLTGTYPAGVAWNGLISVSESPSGAESTALYSNNKKYLSLLSSEEFAATIEAYTYPDEFAACNGEETVVDGVTIGQQTRKSFGLSYRTKLGNDTNENAGYKIHIIYGATAAPSQKAYKTINESPEAITFSWEVKTTPVEVPGFKPTATFTINSTAISAKALGDLEDVLYGTADGEAHLPSPEELLTLVGLTDAE